MAHRVLVNGIKFLKQVHEYRSSDRRLKDIADAPLKSVGWTLSFGDDLRTELLRCDIG